LAEDVLSPVDVPPFDRAAMDGYAVRAEDVFSASESNPIPLRIIGQSIIGSPFTDSVGPGETIQIDTGAKMPEGTNAVVPKEYVERSGDTALVLRSVAPYENVSKRGEDIKRGDVILRKGLRISSYDVSILKSALVSRVKVYRWPRVAIFSCGNELVDEAQEEELTRYGKVIDSSRTMIHNLLRENFCEVIDLGIVRDDPEAIKRKILEAKERADLLVTLGGTSIGERDFVPEAVRSIEGARIVVRGVSMRPGKPVVLSFINDFPIISLPGPPVAAFLGFLFFVKPVLDKLSGIRGVYVPRIIRGTLTKRLPSRPGIKHIARVRVVRQDNEYFVHPIRITGAGVLSSIVKADGLVIVPEDVEGYEVGDSVEVVLLRDRIGVWDEEDL